MNKYLIEHLQTHPLATASDIIKFCYQATFGAEHLLLDTERARYYFDIEYDGTNPAEGLIIEVLSDKIVRVNFAGYKYGCYDKEVLWKAFVNCATTKRGTEAEFINNINVTCQMLLEYFDAKKANQLIEEINDYLNGGIRPIHHSDLYRNSYDPHYRLIEATEVEKILKR